MNPDRTRATSPPTATSTSNSPTPADRRDRRSHLSGCRQPERGGLEPNKPPDRPSGVKRRPSPTHAVAATAVTLLLTACGPDVQSEIFLDEGAPPGVSPSAGAAATWDLKPGQPLKPSMTSLSVLVTRVGCNNGVTGEVNEPRITTTASEVVVTFTVTPEQPGAANCLGNNPKPYTVALPEPLGERALVDGACLQGGEGSGMSSCPAGGVRANLGSG